MDATLLEGNAQTRVAKLQGLENTRAKHDGKDIDCRHRSEELLFSHWKSRAGVRYERPCGQVY